jgi:hypothetical protein
MPRSKVRVVGSNFTTFNYRGQPIAFMDRVADSGQAPFGTGAQAIIPLGVEHPVEIVTGEVLDLGAITLQIRELWNEPVWYQLAGLRGVGESITDVWRALNRDPAEVTCQRLIKPPGSTVWRGTTYHNCKIVNIADGDDIVVGALSVPKGITINYTHKTPFTQPAAA